MVTEFEIPKPSEALVKLLNEEYGSKLSLGFFLVVVPIDAQSRRESICMHASNMYLPGCLPFISNLVQELVAATKQQPTPGKNEVN